MTTPSDKYPDNGSENASAGQEKRDASGQPAPAGTPPLKQGLPLFMRAPRKAMPEESAHTEAAPPPARRDAEAKPEPAPFPDSLDGFGKENAEIPCATIAVDPEGAAECLPADSFASKIKAAESKGSPAAQAEESKVWDYSSRPQAKKAEEIAPAGAEKSAPPPSPEPSPVDGREKKSWLGKGNAGASAQKKSPQPKEAPKKHPPFAASRPILSVEQTMPPSVGSRLFSALALSPLIVLTLMLLIQTIFSLDARALWFSDEIRHADAFRNLLDNGKWLILEMNGAPYPDKPPLYFWFLRGLYELVRTEGPLLYFTAAAISGLLFLWASVALGRFVARVDGKTNLAAGIILLSTGYFMGLLHYARMDLLFAALIICSNIALYRAFVSPRQDYGGMAAAFVLAGLACLVKGPLAFAFPLSAIVLFALWRGTRDQVVCVFMSVAAVLFGLLPGLFGLDILQLCGLNPPTIPNPFSGAAILAPEWGLIFLAPPLIAALLLLAFAPALRLCAGLSVLLMGAVFVLNGSTPYFHWPLLYTLPAAGLALFVLWQITPQRFFRLDFFAGLLVGLGIPALWLAAIYLETGSYDFILNSLLKTQVLERAVDTFHHKEPWHYYLLRLPLMLLPWVILIFFLPWQRLLGKASREGIAASRKPEKEGLAYLWCMAVSALVMLSLLSGKILIYMLPALPAFAILGARGALALSGARARLFRYAMSGLLFLFGVLCMLGALMLFDILPMPGHDFVPGWKLASHGGFYVVAAIAFVIAGLLAFGLGSSRPEGVLLYMALGCSLLGFPLASLVAPSLDAVLSPKAQALIMRAYINEGYAPASYKVYGGTYSFYANSVINELKTQEEIIPLAEKGKLVLGMRASVFDAWEDAPACLTEVHRQWIETKEFVLLACPPIEDLKPAPPPYKESPDMVREAFRRVGIDLPRLGGQSSAPVEQKIVRRGPATTGAEQPEGTKAPADEGAKAPEGGPERSATEPEETQVPSAQAPEEKASDQAGATNEAPAPDATPEAGKEESPNSPPADAPETSPEPEEKAAESPADGGAEAPDKAAEEADGASKPADGASESDAAVPAGGQAATPGEADSDKKEDSAGDNVQAPAPEQPESAPAADPPADDKTRQTDAPQEGDAPAQDKNG